MKSHFQTKVVIGVAFNCNVWPASCGYSGTQHRPLV